MTGIVNVTGARSGVIGNITMATGGSDTGSVVKHEQVLTVETAGGQILGNTYTDVTGSSLTYTPATGASFIVYECNFVMSSTTADTDPMHVFRFVIDGTVTKDQDCYAAYNQGAGVIWSGPRLGHKMMYSASGWTTDKVVKMQARDMGSSPNRGQLFSSFYDYLSADGGDLGGTDRTTDIITTIYSVMA